MTGVQTCALPIWRLACFLALALIAAGFGALFRWGATEGVAGLACVAAFLMLVWAFVATLCRRLVDAGRTRWWLAAPCVFSIIGFIAGFISYTPENPLDSLGDATRTTLTLAILPIMGVALGMFFSKVAAGFLAAIAVWWAFALLLLAPGSRKHD